MARDIEKMQGYYENVPYGDNAKSVEIHGRENHERGNVVVKRLMDMHNQALKAGDKEAASKIETQIYHVDKEYANAEVAKQEHASSLDTTSNWADMGFMDNAMLEQAVVDFNEMGKLTFTAFDPTLNKVVSRTTEEMSSEFEEITPWMQPLMEMKQKLLKARNDRGNPPPFDINFAVNNLIHKNWKSMIADPDPTLDPNGSSKGYRLQQILHSAVDENGVLPENYNLDKYSFDPANDTRLFASISEELNRAFNPNYMSEDEIASADQLMSKLPESNKQMS